MHICFERQALWGLAFLLAVIAVPACGSADEPDVQLTTRYFTVEGTTLAELEQDMLVKGPPVDRGLRHPGAAEIDFTGKVGYARTPEGLCAVADDPAVILHVTLVLPKWNSPADANPKTQIAWSVLVGDIEAHERHHFAIAREWRAKLAAALTKLPPRQSCDQMKRDVAATSDRYLKGHAEAQAAFDRSEYGKTDARIKREINQALGLTK